MSTAARVREKTKRLERGKPFSKQVFSDCGPDTAVRQALSRLAEEGELIRLARGVYARPKPNRFFGTSVPAPEAVAEVLAERRGERIAPHGAELARRLGLSTQVPMQPSFYTSGRTRQVPVANARVFFEHAPEGLVEQANTPAGRALLAMHYLGENRVSPEVLRIIREHVPAEEFGKIEGRRIPPWLRARLEDLENAPSGQ